MSTFFFAFQHPILDAVGMTLLHSLWQGALVFSMLYGVLWILKDASSSLRYTLCSASLVLMILLPVSTGLQGYMLEEGRVSRHEIVEYVAPNSEESLSFEHDAGVLSSADSPTQLLQSPAAGVKAISPAIPWRSMLAGLWMIAVLLFSLYWLRGTVASRRLLTHSEPVAQTAIVEIFDALLEKLEIGRPVRLCVTLKVDQPLLMGWLKPVILLPFSVLTNLSPSHLEAILAHELAHVRRHDYLVLQLQVLAETLFFFHPAVWWVSRQMRIEREYCCDDEAARLIGNDVVYVSALAGLEGLRMKQLNHGLSAMGGRLVDRIRRIVDRNNAPIQKGCSWPALGVAIALCSLLVGACLNRSTEDIEGTPDELLDAAVEAATRRDYVGAQHLAERAAGDGSVCANEFLSVLLSTRKPVTGNRDGSRSEPIRWAGEDEEASLKWGLAYKEALEGVANRGDSRAMLALYLMHKEYGGTSLGYHLGIRSDSLSAIWLDRALEQDNALAWRIHGNRVYNEKKDAEGAWHAYERAIELGDEGAYERWSWADSTPENGPDPQHFFEIASLAVDRKAAGTRDWLGKVLRAIDQEMTEGNENTVPWAQMADSLKLAERIQELPETEYKYDTQLIFYCNLDWSWLHPVISY